MGLGFAALTVVFKRTEPVIQLFNSASALLGGVLFPVEVLPSALQVISKALPLTAALDGVRSAFLMGAGWAELLPSILILGGFLVVLVPASILLFRWALRRAMRDGTLTQY